MTLIRTHPPGAASGRPRHHPFPPLCPRGTSWRGGSHRKGLPSRTHSVPVHRLLQGSDDAPPAIVHVCETCVSGRDPLLGCTGVPPDRFDVRPLGTFLEDRPQTVTCEGIALLGHDAVPDCGLPDLAFHIEPVVVRLAHLEDADVHPPSLALLSHLTAFSPSAPTPDAFPFGLLIIIREMECVHQFCEIIWIHNLYHTSV